MSADEKQLMIFKERYSFCVRVSRRAKFKLVNFDIGKQHTCESANRQP